MPETHLSAAPPAPTQAAGTLYGALADSLQQRIALGTLRPGHRVPPVRRMGLQRDVSITTALQAYALFESAAALAGFVIFI